MLKVWCAILALAGGIVLPALAQAAPSCREEIGPRAATDLVRQCRNVSPATRPPCDAANSCALIRDEIRRGCNFMGADAPTFCESYRQENGDDDGDEDGEE